MRDDVFVCYNWAPISRLKVFEKIYKVIEDFELDYRVETYDSIKIKGINPAFFTNIIYRDLKGRKIISITEDEESIGWTTIKYLKEYSDDELIHDTTYLFKYQEKIEIEEKLIWRVKILQNLFKAIEECDAEWKIERGKLIFVNGDFTSIPYLSSDEFLALFMEKKIVFYSSAEYKGWKIIRYMGEFADSDLVENDTLKQYKWRERRRRGEDTDSYSDVSFREVFDRDELDPDLQDTWDSSPSISPWE